MVQKKIYYSTSFPFYSSQCIAQNPFFAPFFSCPVFFFFSLCISLPRRELQANANILVLLGWALEIIWRDRGWGVQRKIKPWAPCISFFCSEVCLQPLQLWEDLREAERLEYENFKHSFMSWNFTATKSEDPLYISTTNRLPARSYHPVLDHPSASAHTAECRHKTPNSFWPKLYQIHIQVNSNLANCIIAQFQHISGWEQHSAISAISALSVAPSDSGIK